MICVLSRSLIISDLTFWHFTVIYYDPSFNYIQLSLVTRSVLVNKHIKSRGLSKSRRLECVPTAIFPTGMSLPCNKHIQSMTNPIL